MSANMSIYCIIENSSYRLEYNAQTNVEIKTEKYQSMDDIRNLTKLASPYDYIEECSDDKCIYSRSISTIRTLFEKRITNFSKNKDKLNVLFIGSYMLLQELKILMMLKNNISEIHLADNAYKEFNSSPTNKYNILFKQFFNFVRDHNLTTKIYVHTNPLDLCNSVIFKQRFDIIAGIDFDYADQNHLINRENIKKIASITLKTNGRLFISQHFQDMVDISEYEYDSNNNINIVRVTDLAKNKYYLKYMSENIFEKFVYPLLITGMITSIIIFNKSMLGSLFIGINSTFGLLYRWFFVDTQTNFKRVIKKMDDYLIKK
jgi:hypothetical protein